jgi:hypothetical protein
MSGHEQVGPRETIASFGVNSVSIAELSAFVRTRFGYHVGILDLMTTATPESVAEAIISGKAAEGAGQDPGAAGNGAGGRARWAEGDSDHRGREPSRAVPGGPGVPAAHRP